MTICKCGICALDCEYHRPAPEEKKGKYSFQWEEIDQHGVKITREVQCVDPVDIYEIRLGYYGHIQQPPPPSRKTP